MSVRTWRLALGLVPLIAGAVLVHTWVAQPLRLEWFLARVALQQRLAEPKSGLLDGYWFSAILPVGNGMPDYSPAAEMDYFRRAERDYRHWSGYRCEDYEARLSETCAALGHVLRLRAEGHRWRLYSYPVNPLFGVQSNLPGQMIGAAEFASWSDVDAAIRRMQIVSETVDGVMQGLHERQQAGLHPPRVLVEHVLLELRAFVAQPVEHNVLMAGFRERISSLASDPADPLRRQREEAARRAIEQVVYPAWQSLIAHFEQLRPIALHDRGAWSQPHGTDWYAYSLRLHTSTELSPQQVYELGQREVARITAELDPLLQAVGEIEGSVGMRLLRLAERPDQLFPASPQGHRVLLSHVRRVVAESRPLALPFFEHIVAAPLAVAAVPRAREATAPLAYYAGSRGGDGTLYINLRDVRDLPRFSLPTLAHHEVIPGHHLQTIAQRAANLPAIRGVLPFTAYAEGWAMYAERLAGEIGMTDEPLDTIGRLQSELFRAARLVVDTGIHFKRWERERAIAYLHERAGIGLRDASAEIDRYLVYPGQALSFMIGMQRILAARERAREALGSKFDLRDFHAAVLDGGGMPLDLLDQRIDRYIEATRHGAAP